MVELMVTIGLTTMVVLTVIHVITYQMKIVRVAENSINIQQNTKVGYNRIMDLLNEHYNLSLEDSAIISSKSEEDIEILFDYQENRKNGILNYIKEDTYGKIVNKENNIIIDYIKTLEVVKKNGDLIQLTIICEEPDTKKTFRISTLIKLNLY